MRLNRVVVVVLAIASLAASRPPVFRPNPENLPPAAPAALAQSARLVTPDVTLAEPAPRHFGGEPPQVGIVRALPSPQVVGAGRSAVAIRSTGASRVRLHLTGVDLPPGVLLSIAGTHGDAVSFGRELLGPDGDLWTPTVEGETAVVSAPAGAHFVVADVSHISVPAASSIACLTDASCATFPDLETLSKAVAQLVYTKTDGTYVCTGGLINGPDGDRLFLTANHCISTQAEASSLELTWDLRTTACGASTKMTTTRTNGATLLATSATTDVTLLRLNSLPAGRWLMGWDTAPVAAGTTLYRISHPFDSTVGLFPQVYSTSTAKTTGAACGSLPRPNFLYSTHGTGGTAGGSSGSPVITQGGYIVGQLFGLCGVDPSDGCLASSMPVDGSMQGSFPLLQQYLSPSGSQCATCTPNANTACAMGGRFKITIDWKDDAAKLAGVGTILKYADNVPEVDPQFGVVSESTFFAFYTSAPKSIEVLVRIISGHGVNDKFWVFVTGFTGSQYTVTIEDTHTCATWQRTIPAASTNVVKDFNAFPLP